MKTAHIITLTAAGAVGSLLLGGGAFAAGAAIGSDARENRIEQVQEHSHERGEQGEKGEQGQRGERGQKGERQFGAGKKHADRGSFDRTGENHPRGEAGPGNGDARPQDRRATQMSAQHGLGSGGQDGPMHAPDNLGTTLGGL
ncbi:Putative secreted protein [Pontimonas salivibrio]|uniref:Secreted protein n=1 Tax=Pontimonas salivibrio TaxID=1159327 RepID=A0A2L2BS59_9MICO|nr:Putative secreted protein [Pontimonas salivibrio]